MLEQLVDVSPGPTFVEGMFFFHMRNDTDGCGMISSYSSLICLFVGLLCHWMVESSCLCCLVEKFLLVRGVWLDFRGRK